MADLITVREWVRLMLWLVGALFIAALLVTWNMWYQASGGGDGTMYLFSMTVSGALALLWACLLLVYVNAHRLLYPRALSRRFTKLATGMVWFLMLFVFCAVFGYGYHLFSRHETSAFSLLRLGELAPLEQQILVDPTLLKKTEGNDGATLLTIAFESDDPEAVAMLLRQGAPTEPLFSKKRSPLVVALNNPVMLEALLNGGFDPDVCADDGVPPLHYAVVLEDMKAIQLLLNAGASLESVDRMGRTALIRAVSVESREIMDYLLVQGAMINAQDKHGNTPLHKAVRHDCNDGVLSLLEQGGDPTIFNYAGFSALHVAAISGQREIAEILLQIPGLVSLCNADGQSAFDFALRGKKYETARLLLQNGADASRIKKDGSTALHSMIAIGDYQSVRFLLEEGADAMLPDAQGKTSYELLRQKHKTKLIELIPEEVRLLEASISH